MQLRLVLINRQMVWGGGEYWTLQAALELRKLGHPLQVLASQDGPLAQRLKAESLPLLEVPVGIGDWFGFKSNFRSACQSIPPDLWVANALLDLTLINWVQGPSFRAPVLLVRGQDSPLGRRLTQRFRFRSVSRVVVNSEATRRSFTQSVPWFPPGRIHCVLRGVRAGPFLTYSDPQQVQSIRDRFSIPREARVVGILGRLESQKGHEILLRALAELPDAHLLVVGQGSLQARLRRLAEEVQIDHRCHWVGQVADVRPYLALSDLVAVPSLFEGFCFAAVEAQLMGRPVVASRVSSLPEVIEEGQGGLLVPAGNVEALRDAMLALLRSPSRRRELGEAGRRIAVERFDFEERFRDFESVLHLAAGDSVFPAWTPRLGRWGSR